jgi:hypothetical protein
VIDEGELGRVATKIFEISNQGDAELYIHSIRSNCSCTGIERIIDGEYVRLKDLRIEPNGVAKVAVRVSVRNVPAGSTMLNHIEFDCNDPNSPMESIDVLVTCVLGGISFTPNSVVFSPVIQGQTVVRRIEIRDYSKAPRKVERVTSLSPNALDAHFLPPPEKEQAFDEDRGGFLLGFVEIKVNTARIGSLNGLVQITCGDSNEINETIRVEGNIVPTMEFFPTKLMLPRESSNGEMLEASCIFVSHVSSNTTITPIELPDFVSCEIVGREASSPEKILVKIDRKWWMSLKDNEQLILKFLAKNPEGVSTVELPIFIQAKNR